MTAAPQTHRQRRALEKRDAIIRSATTLFLQGGYAETSLVRIAELADVSTATLFKYFPTKAELFAAMVTEYWQLPDADVQAPAAADPAAGLRALGNHYVEVMSRDGMVDLFRIVIAEAPRFPDLADTQFRLGKVPLFEKAIDYLRQQHEAGNLDCDDPELAADQFFSMIANFALWRRMMLPNWHPTDQQLRHRVEEAVRVIMTCYGVGSGP